MFKTNLIEECKKQNRKAQLKLYNQYCDGMLCIAMRYLKQKDLAEDATQEAFIKAFKNIDSFTGETTFGAWLKRIVINQSIDYYRQHKYHENIEDVNLEVAEDEDHTWQVNENTSIADIRSCIEGMDDKYATVLKLYLMEGYDHDEIAGILNIKPNNSRIQLHRGKKLLKEKLKSLRYERFA